MAHVAANLKDNDESQEFAALLDDTLEQYDSFEGTVIKGKIIDINDGFALIDVGLKSEGRVSLREFSVPGQEPEVRVGDEVEVYVDRMEDREGRTVLSREKARREEVWAELEESHEKEERVTGVIFGRVKGGFTVDLGGAVAFLPGSQVDIRPVRDISPLMNTPQPFHILKMDKSRGNIVVSRRAVLEESREEVREELLETLKEGMVLKGVVKNITDYGAFIDLGGVDGLLHVTDISWKRVNHPSDIVSIGETVEVQVIRYDEEKQRISLGMKQLNEDPWEGISNVYHVGEVYKGRVNNITDYGAFVELAPGIEGLVHVSEMSWTKKNIHPGKIVSTSQEIDVQILDVDEERRRISLGLKQTMENPWEKFAKTHKPGDTLEGEVKNVTEFGVFVGLPGEIDGMVHLTDVSWEDQSEAVLQQFEKGETVEVKVLDIDPEKERVALGIKQLTEDPFAEALEGIKKGDTVTCTVTDVQRSGINVNVGEELTGFIKKSDLSQERSEQRPDRFAVGEKVDAKVVSIDRKSRQLKLSIKAREIAENKKALKEFGSADSGASLGDILGAALGDKEEEGEEASEAKKETKKTKKAEKSEEKPEEKKAKTSKKKSKDEKKSKEKSEEKSEDKSKDEEKSKDEDKKKDEKKDKK